MSMLFAATYPERTQALVLYEPFKRWWARFERLGASPSAAIALMHMNNRIDIRHVLPSIRVPTLVLHGVSNGCTKIVLQIERQSSIDFHRLWPDNRAVAFGLAERTIRLLPKFD